MSARRTMTTWAAAACAAALLAVGCGDDDEQPEAAADGGRAATSASREERTPYISMSEVERVLERELMLQRDGQRPDRLASGIEPEPDDVTRFAAVPSGREFDMLVFSTPERAEAAEAGIRASEVVDGGGSFRRAANVVAVFPEQPGVADTYQVAAEQLEKLDRACTEPGDPTFGELCYGVADAILPDTGNKTQGPDDPGPEGPGTERGDTLDAGSTVQLGGLEYRPVLTRPLNPSLRPDQALLEGVDVDRTGGPQLFVVALLVCNEEGPAETATDDIILQDAFGNRYEPVPLPPDNQFAYQPRRLAEGTCLPDSGSAANEALGGGALVFRVPLEARRANAPFSLRLTSEDGTTRTVAVDV